MAKVLTGGNCSTNQNLMTGKGVFFKNYKMDIDTPETALAMGKCIGATRGGGEFNATPNTRAVAIDGMSDRTEIDSWAATMTANVLEIKPETMKDALATGVLSEDVNDYVKIRARNEILPSDYIENITFIGYLKGNEEPIVIQIYNAISTSGLNLTLSPNDEVVMAITWTASSDPCIDPDSAEFGPFAIYYPKSIPLVTVDKIFTDSVTITGKGSTGAVVVVKGGTIPDNTSQSVGSDGLFTITITPQAVGTKITAHQEIDGKKSSETITYVEQGTGDSLKTFNAEKYTKEGAKK